MKRAVLPDEDEDAADADEGATGGTEVAETEGWTAGMPGRVPTRDTEVGSMIYGSQGGGGAGRKDGMRLLEANGRIGTDSRFRVASQIFENSKKWEMDEKGRRGWRGGWLEERGGSWMNERRWMGEGSESRQA